MDVLEDPESLYYSGLSVYTPVFSNKKPSIQTHYRLTVPLDNMPVMGQRHAVWTNLAPRSLFYASEQPGNADSGRRLGVTCRISHRTTATCARLAATVQTPS